MYRTGIVFGTFDGLHPGHISFFQEAHTHAEHIIVALATNTTVYSLKKVKPLQSFTQRKSAILAGKFAQDICKSELHDDYKCLRKYLPSCILLGYDQTHLHQDLLNWMNKHKIDIPIIVLSAYHPNQFKSSLLYVRHTSHS